MEFFHIAPRPYNAIKRPIDRGVDSMLKFAYNDKRKREMVKELSFFFCNPEFRNLNMLKDANFKPYQVNVFFIHKCIIKPNEIVNISLESAPDAIEYGKKHWNPPRSPSAFSEYKERYYEERADALGYDPNSITYVDLQKKIKELDLCNIDKYFKLNKNYGSKRQYAAYIPHIILRLEKEVAVSKIITDTEYKIIPNKHSPQISILNNEYKVDLDTSPDVFIKNKNYTTHNELDDFIASFA